MGNNSQHFGNVRQQNHYLPHHEQRTWPREQPCVPKQNREEHGIETDSTPDSNKSQKAFKTFRDLAIWQKGILLVKSVYQKTSLFPKEELYGLVAQMRKAAVSIPSNIAEGYRRKHAKEFQQFLNVALGSIGELETQVILSKELNYLSEENFNYLAEALDHLVRMTVSLSQKVQR